MKEQQNLMRTIFKYAITFTILGMLFCSCSKPDDLCGIVTNGDVEWNDYRGDYDYYLIVDGERRYVTEKIYSQYAIGESVCLYY